MKNPEAVERMLADHALIGASLPGAGLPWLAREREAALARFAVSGFPTTHDEDWKYTSVAPILRQALVAGAGVGDADAAAGLIDALQLEPQTGHWLVFVDGRHAPQLSSLKPLPAGVVLGSLARALEQEPTQLAPHLPALAGQTVFGDLNTAFMADGAYLYLPDGAEVEEPVHLLFLTTQSGVALHSRNLLIAGAGARATVIEHHAGAAGAVYLHNVVTQIILAENAAIGHYKLQQESAQAFHVAGIHASQQRGSRFESHSISLGAQLARNDIATVFQAEGCDATLNGLYLAADGQHVDHHTLVDHAAPAGSSREYYRGVLDGAGRAVFNGKVIVRPGAQKTNAQQSNHNLLLSRDAEIDTKPQLEIYADDVQCTHGATVGQIDEQQRFYLRSRGIDDAVAQALLVHAFAHDVVERIGVPSLRQRLERILLARLPQAGHLGETA